MFSYPAWLKKANKLDMRNKLDFAYDLMDLIENNLKRRRKRILYNLLCLDIFWKKNYLTKNYMNVKIFIEFIYLPHFGFVFHILL